MNSSDQPLSHEEKWAAYVEGQLGTGEAEAFEREHPDAAAEKALALKIRQSLRQNLSAPALRNPELFNEQILREIGPPSQQAGRPVAQPSLWSLWRMAFAGACCLLAAAAIYAVFVMGNDPSRDRYVAQVLSVKAGDDLLDATLLDAEGLAVLWIDGLDQLPSDYVLQ